MRADKALKAVLITVLLVSAAALVYILVRPKGNSDNDASYVFENCLYYDSMSESDRDLYRLYYDLVMHKDEKGYYRMISMDRFEYAVMKDRLVTVYDEMLMDHPQFFYLEGATGRDLDIRGIETSVISVFKVSIGPGVADENEMIAVFEKAADDFMSDIDLTASDAEKELQIHDKLIEMVTYDYDLLDVNATMGDLGHTAYGALVADSRGYKHRAVCDGYAKAFQYLLAKAGICAAFVSGEADSEAGTLSEEGTHAWNIVRLDGEWYEVDSCWNDIDPPPEAPDDPFYAVLKLQQPQYFNATHHWYNRTTEQMKNLPANPDAAIRVQEGYGIYELNHCTRSSHIREEGEYDNLPKAYGTSYGL